MGKPRFPRKKYDTPLHPWKEERIKTERSLMKKYGLKNHREVWKARTRLRKYRGQARALLAKFSSKDPQIEKESSQLLLHLTRMGILTSGGTLDDVLALDTEKILNRRLQTLVYKRGFANTSYHARQLVSHGHITIGDRRVSIPGYLVTKDEENTIGYTPDSPLNAISHPARPKTDFVKAPPETKPPREETSPQPTEKKPEEKPPKETPKELSKDKPQPVPPVEKKEDTPAPTPAKQEPEQKKKEPAAPEKPKEGKPTETSQDEEKQKSENKEEATEPKDTSSETKEPSTTKEAPATEEKQNKTSKESDSKGEEQ